ncbi:MAG: dephospho-CoA kinase, partial [Oscillospiraceae bacterium]|nr:dephospho-CoA kinase [Oscillospiraceae bacterium]
MKVLGITGGTGCGKTTLLKAAKELGFRCIDCDALYHELLVTDGDMLRELEEAFPQAFTGGILDRKALGRVVFQEEEKLLRLNGITHRYVKEEVLRRMEGADYAAIDAIALIEGGLGELCDTTVAVTAPEELRVQRLMKRDNITEEYALLRIRAQKSAEEFQAMTAHHLCSDTDIESFENNCKNFIKGVFHMEEKKYEEQRKALLNTPKNGYDRISAEDLAAMEPYCKEYMDFISTCKIEREAVEWTIAVAEQNGFKPLVPGMELKPGDRVYGNNHKKAVIFAVIGEKSLNEGTHICASHIDSPRLDLKPNPLYEDSEMAFFKTHYYGGIKKYQWTTTPLALHGAVVKKDGSVINITVGEDPTDPVFCVTDLLIHLSADQMRKTLAEGITGENLNILLGSKPLAEDEGADRIKFAVMCLLNEKYGLIEEDFLTAELTMVPAGPAREVGFDRSLIAAYGHDDRVCAFASFKPLLELGIPAKTAVCVLADKEEVGSNGISGMQSDYFETFMADLCEATGASLRRCFENSFCLSADVS